MERPLSLLALLALSSLLSPYSSSTNALQLEQAQSSLPNRREIMGSVSALATALITPQAASAVYNPLNLKGSYWETGELYVKKENALPNDPDELLPYFLGVSDALENIRDLVLEGRYTDLSRKLRGGVVSESRIRLRGYALLDTLPDTDDRQSGRLAYICTERFRVFLAKFQTLDATVEAAARQGKVDGGLVETLGMAVLLPFSAAEEVAKISSEPEMGRDPRLNVLAALEETLKAARAFTKAVEEALKSN